MDQSRGTKIQRGIFITWSALWYLALLPGNFIHQSLSLIFLQIEYAISSWDARYLTFGFDAYQNAVWSYRLSSPILLFIFGMSLATGILTLKFGARIRCSVWVWRILWTGAMILSFCFVRSEVIVASNPWEAVWHWFGALIIMTPFWLFQPTDLQSFWRVKPISRSDIAD